MWCPDEPRIVGADLAQVDHAAQPSALVYIKYLSVEEGHAILGVTEQKAATTCRNISSGSVSSVTAASPVSLGSPLTQQMANNKVDRRRTCE